MARYGRKTSSKGWATHAIEKLANGEEALIRPKGHSMKGKVNHNDSVLLAPPPDELSVGDIVLVKVNKRVYLHLIKAVNENRFLIGNNKGGINGWVGRNSIYGIAVEVNKKGI